jgi:hypothetical protein
VATFTHLVADPRRVLECQCATSLIWEKLGTPGGLMRLLQCLGEDLLVSACHRSFLNITCRSNILKGDKIVG